MMPNAKIEEIVSVTLSVRERRKRDIDPRFRFLPSAYDRICQKIDRLLPQMSDESQIVDVISGAVEREERVMIRAASESAWSLRRDGME